MAGEAAGADAGTANPGTIATAAGSVGNGYGPALGQVPLNVAYAPPDADHPAGSLYISDWVFHNVVRRLDLKTGQETVVAGNGGTGFNGDGPATSVMLKFPWGIAPDSHGNVYIADSRRVRRLDPSGQLVTVVDDRTLEASGVPPRPFFGTFDPTGLVIDDQGDLLIASYPDFRVLRFDPASGVVTVVAGTGRQGYNGDNQPATSAQLFQPWGVAVDAAGSIYIPDRSRIRRVDTNGIITTVAGTGTAGNSGDGGPAVDAEINSTSQLSFDAAGNLYLVDSNSGRVRKIDTSGIITTVAGGGTTWAADGVPALSARFNTPFYGATVAPDGTLFIADSNGSKVWRVNDSGSLVTEAGNGTLGESGDGGPATEAQTSHAYNVAFDSEGNYYVADWVMSVVRKVSPDGTITTVAGLVGGNQYTPGGYRGYNGDGIPATRAKLHSPAGMAVDAEGNLYIADSFSNRVRMVDTDGVIHTVAGTGTAGYSGDGGPATEAKLDYPNGVTLDSHGNLYIADTGEFALNPFTLGGNRIRKVSPDGIITTVAGNGIGGYNGDGIPALVAEVNGPYGVAVDGADNLYVADTFNSRIRKIDMGGVVPIISTVAGNGTAGFSGDGGPATSARLGSPTGVSVDGKGNIAIADPNFFSQRVRLVDASGQITTIAGTGTPGLSGDGGPATEAMLAYPGGVAFDAAGNVFIADGFWPFGNNRVRKVFLAGQVPDPTPTETASPTPTESLSPSPSESPEPETATVTFTERSAQSGQYSDETLFEARLADASGDPIAGQELVFELIGAESSRGLRATTDDDGIASASPTLDEKPGSYQLTVRYAGDDDHHGSADTTGFVVEEEDTALELEVRGQGNKRTLNAHLSDLDSPADGISGRTIAFYSDGEPIGSARTDSDGVATVAVPPGHRGANRTYETVFEGDDFYRGSSDERPGQGGGHSGEAGGTTQVDRSHRGAVLLYE